jgi:hypothetical protein
MSQLSAIFLRNFSLNLGAILGSRYPFWAHTRFLPPHDVNPMGKGFAALKVSDPRRVLFEPHIYNPTTYARNTFGKEHQMKLLFGSRRGITDAWTMAAVVFPVLFLLTRPATAQISAQNISVQNGGSLTYSVVSIPKPCGTQFLRPPLPQPEYDLDTYSNFVYTNVAGIQTDLTGSAQYVQNTSTSLGVCAINKVTPVLLDGGGYLIQFTPGGNSTVGTAVLQTPLGYLNPKYVILGVTYAPPGPSSFVQYTTTTFLSTTSSMTNSTSSANAWSASVAGEFNCASFLKGKVTATNSGSYKQASSSTSSFTLSAQTVNSGKTPGTANAFSPVNHDYDRIWLWLNPVVILTVDPTSQTVTWDGYGVDAADQSVTVMDIWNVQVGYLNGHFGPLDPGDAQVLARNWAVGYLTWPSGEGPGLTQADFDQILLADPFAANSSYAVTVPAGSNTTADGRFSLVTVTSCSSGSNCSSGSGNSSGMSTTFDYQQADPGETALTQSLTTSYTTSSTQSSSTTVTTTQAYGIDLSFTGSAFLASLSADFKDTQTLTSIQQTSGSITNSESVGAMLSITGPPCSGVNFPCNPTYNGIPSEFDVYQDNIYGTFMFNGVN